MRTISIVLYCLFLLTGIIGYSQDSDKSDSLYHALENAKHDTVKLKCLNQLGLYWMDKDPKIGIEFGRKAEQLALKLGRKRDLAASYYIIGTSYSEIQSFTEALEYYYKAMPIREELKDTASLLRLYNRIGILHSYQKNHNDALKYFQKFFDLVQYRNDTLLLANCYANMGVSYKNLGRNDLAQQFYIKALNVFLAKNEKRGIASCYLNIGVNYDIRKMYDSSQVYNFMALAIFREIKDPFGTTTSYSNIADSYHKLKDLKNAIIYYDSTLLIAEKANDGLHLRDAYLGYSKAMAERGDYKKAYEYFLKHALIRDSVFSSENINRSANLEAKHNILKAEKELEILKKNEEIQDLQISRTWTYVFILVFALFSIGVIAWLMFQRNKAKQKVNDILEMQNVEITAQKTEITDSINYACRIQESILPPERLIKNALPDSFILYLPKDIVSGDFYWVDKKGNKSLFAAVDCTGHGVPGAMMSVLGFNLIHQAVNDKNLTLPSEILKHLDNGVNMTLRQSSTDNTVRDGMDLALCCLDWEKMELQYAGAYNALWYLKKNAAEITEIKADKKIIGSNVNDVADEFTNHVVKLEKGDLVYILSDGYADQFGGPKNKKFKYKPLKELLVSVRNRSMNEQRSILEKTVREWQSIYEQVDDILVIAVRI